VCLDWVNQHAVGMRHIVCHLWPVRLYHTFPHYLINNTFVGREITGQKCVSWVYLQLLSATFPMLNGIQRNTICVHSSSHNIPNMPVRISWNMSFVDIFSKSNRTSSRPKPTKGCSADLRRRRRIEHQISCQWVQCKTTCSMWTGRHDEANNRFPRFYQRAWNDTSVPQLGIRT